MRQHLCQKVVTDAAIDDIRRAVNALHQSLPRLVNVLKALHFDRQLFDHISAREHRFQIDPKILNDQPVVGDLQRIGQVSHPFVDTIFKRSAVSVTHDRHYTLIPFKLIHFHFVHSVFRFHLSVQLTMLMIYVLFFNILLQVVDYEALVKLANSSKLISRSLL